MRGRDSTEYTEFPAIGHAVETGSKSYDRVYGMLLGVRVHIGRLSAQPPPELRPEHFSEFEKLKMPRQGNRVVPSHQGRYDYMFKSYAPVVFLYLRHFFGISDGQYMNEITGDYMMSELKMIGRSSAMFYYTWDGKYVLKTLTKEEMNCLRKILPVYYGYVTTH